MNKNQLGIFKIALFIFGIAIIGAAFLIVNLPFSKNGISADSIFFWINILAMYLVFFCPFFFSSISTKNLDAKIASTIAVWISVFIFEIVAFILAVLVLALSFNLKAAAIIELVLFFVCAIFIFLGYFSGNHIANVQAAEQKTLEKADKKQNQEIDFK